MPDDMTSPDEDVPSGRVFLAGTDAHLVGALGVVTRPLLGLFCSVACPGGVILGAYDLASALRDAGITVVGGFHSPVEHECLRLLLRGTQPLVIAPARTLAGMHVPPEWQEPLASRRLALIAPVGQRADRATADLAARRNAFVARLATRLLILHATPGGRVETLTREALASGKPIFTLASEHNAHLVALGAQPISAENVSALS